MTCIYLTRGTNFVLQKYVFTIRSVIISRIIIIYHKILNTFIVIRRIYQHLYFSLDPQYINYKVI